MWFMLGNHLVNSEECKSVSLSTLPTGYSLTAYMKSGPDLGVFYSKGEREAASAAFSVLGKILRAY